MSHTRFYGMVPPVVTPFNPDGTIDHETLAAVVNHLIDAGMHGLFAMGSTGEVAYLSNEDRIAMLKTIVETNAGRVPVIAGAIELTAKRSIEAAKAAMDTGADAFVVTAPIYAINDVTEMKAHFRAIGAAVDAPMFIYDIPVRVHKKIPHDLLVRLGQDGVAIGVKDSSDDDVGFRRLVMANRAAGSPLRVFTGHEVVVDGMLLLGADGVVPGLANVDAVRYAKLWDAAQAGDWTRAREIQDELATLFEIVFQAAGRSGDAAGVGAFKVAMAAQGLLPSPTMAAPVQALDGDVADRIVEIVRASGL